MRIDFPRPLKQWTNYAKLLCSVCNPDKPFYRENVGIAAVCNKCSNLVQIVSQYSRKDPDSSKITGLWKKEELTHVRTLGNGQKIGVTNKGNIIDDADFRQQLRRDPYMFRRAGLASSTAAWNPKTGRMEEPDGRPSKGKKAKYFVNRSDFKDLK